MVEALKEKTGTKYFTAEQLDAVSRTIPKELGEPLVAEVTLGRTLSLLERNGLKINYNSFLVLDNEEQMPGQLVLQKTEVVYFKDSLSCGYIEYFDPAEEDVLRSRYLLSPVQDWERRNVQLILDNLPKTEGIRWDIPSASNFGEILLHHLQTTGEHLLANHLLWMKDLCLNVRDMEPSGRPRKDVQPRHLVMEYLGKDGVYASFLPGGLSGGAGIFVVGFPETVSLSPPLRLVQ